MISALLTARNLPVQLTGPHVKCLVRFFYGGFYNFYARVTRYCLAQLRCSGGDGLFTLAFLASFSRYTRASHLLGTISNV